MSDLVNAFDSSTWDPAERAYFHYVDGVIAKRKNQRFSNGKPWHAAYLIFKFLGAAQRQVRIFSGALLRRTPEGVRIYEEPRIVEAACAFLKRPETTLWIALQQAIDAPEGDANKHPLVAGVHRLKQHGHLRGSLEVRRVRDETVDSLRQRSALYHMMLLDERGWRLETAPNLPGVKAIVNAGNTKEAAHLCRAFDIGVWPHGETVAAVSA